METKKAHKRIRIKIPKINLPDYPYDKVEPTIIGKYILFASADVDEGNANPCEDMDGFGMIRSLSNRHVNHISREEATELLESDQDVVPLSYFEHGNSKWFTMGSTPTPGIEFQWDGVRFAGIWIPDDCVRESYTGQDGLSRRDWMIQQADSACETYTQWCNGEIYYYNVSLYKIKTEDGHVYDDRDDYRFTEAVFEDSCGGCYGSEYVIEELTSAVRSALSKIGFSKRAIAKALPKK